MENRYIVLDHDGNVSSGIQDKRDAEPEVFSSYRSAEKRAKDLANHTPGEMICIYELTGEVIAPVGKVESSRKHPIEHYK